VAEEDEAAATTEDAVGADGDGAADPVQDGVDAANRAQAFDEVFVSVVDRRRAEATDDVGVAGRGRAVHLEPVEPTERSSRRLNRLDLI
jgi:hypothetical protein